ncbi:4-oxalocrotonate tautomerase DmpI [Methanobrevibacter filiformis]|uniref:2-hydroxymuconate tautomerase n=1 Tax=Methanobrevibacter filiformis TaxID=55758 RepID=A0A166E2P1_9EURY|nr:4-oxalocrotonate tautomerase DmpI [Methanobrevibacter filiformis]KZX16213.1 2-hydroxymuconate tautomerase [Methanobrevibacter filiformis]
MPVIIVESNEIDVDKKREYVKKLTEITAETYNLQESTVTVLIREIKPDNIGVGGKLLSDLK